VLAEQDQFSPLWVLKNTRPVVVAGGRLELPGQALPIDPYSGLTPVRAVAGMRAAGPAGAWSGAVPAIRPGRPDTMAGPACESGADFTEMLAPLAADSIRARVQYSTVRPAAVLASLGLAVTCPDAPAACGVTAVTAVAALAGTAAAQSSATPAARPVAIAARPSRERRAVLSSSGDLRSDVMTTPLLSLR
jgi:hypothetical protein